MEEVVLKPEWSYFDVRNSKIVSDFFNMQKIDYNEKSFSLNALRNYYRYDRINGSYLIEELALRGYTFNTNNESSFLPRSFDPKKIIRINHDTKNCFKKINFNIMGLSGIVQKYSIDSDLFFDYIPLEGFLILNNNISIDMVENEFKNAGFVVEAINKNTSINVIDIINLSKLGKLSDIFKEKAIFNIEDLCEHFDEIITKIPNLNKYDVKKLKLITEWFDKDYRIKDFRNVFISDYFNFRNVKFDHYCTKNNYTEVIDLIADLNIYNFDKDVVLYYETFVAYLKTYYFLNIESEIGSIEIKEIPNLGTRNTIDLLYESGIRTIKDLLKADLYNMSGLGKGKIINIEVSLFDFINNPIRETINKHAIQESLYNIKIDDLFKESGLSSFTDYCEKNNYIYVRDLVGHDLSSILKSIKMLGKTKTNEITKKLMDEKYNVPSPGELVKILYSEAIENNKDLYSIVFERIIHNKTLEELGNENNVTRERIRQQEAKGLRILRSVSNIFYDIVLKNSNYICIDAIILDEIFNDINESTIMFDILKNRSEFYHNEYIDKIFIVDNFPECNIFFSEIEAILNGEDEDSKDFTTLEEINNKINRIINKYSLDKYLTCDDFNKMIDNCNYKQVGNMFMKKGIYIHDIFSNILKEYFPDGMTFDEKNCDLMKQKYFEITGEKSDLSVRNLTAKLQRENDVVLRGPNTYIHIDNVKIDNNLLEVIRKYILHLFEHEGVPSIYSDKIYNVFKEELNSYGIDNYSYIYGVLRYYYPEEFVYNNFWIAKNGNKGVTRDLALVDYLKNDTNYNEGIPKEKIISLFGLSGPFLLNLTFNSTEIHECHNKENLIYYDNYRLSDKLLEKIENYIENNIDSQYGYISLKHLLNKFNIYLEEEKIIDEYTLGNALKKYLTNYFISGLYVCKEQTDANLDEYFFFDLYLNNNDIITRKGYELYAEEKGIYANRIYDVLKNRFDKLYQINITDFTSDIGISSEVISEIYNLIDRNMDGKKYIPLSDLKKNGDLFRMPRIEYSWNEYLLRSVLIKNPSDKYIIIDIPGPMLYTEKGILVRKDLNIKNYIDFLVYVYNEKNYYLIDNVNQLYKELQSKGLISDTLPNDFRKIVVDDYGRLRRC